MSATKLREPRLPVRLSVRVKTDLGWETALVQNVSSRGMMVSCATPPPRGAYVEVRRGAYVVVGRIVWSSNDRFGLFAQDAIVVSDLTASMSLGGRNDRRREPRKAELSRALKKDPTETGAASARFARAFDFAAVAVAAIAGAVLLAETTSEVLTAPLEKARVAME